MVRTLRQLFCFIFPVLIIICSTTTSCFLFEKKKKSKKSSSGLNLIDKDSIFVDRIADGTGALIKFNTFAPAFCELAFYAQDSKGTPTKDTATVSTCSGTDAARQEFREQLKDWRSDTLYFVEIRAWTNKDAPQERQVLTVRESPDGIPIDPGSSFDGLYRDLFVMRFNAPLRTAEIHRHVPASAIDAAGIRATFNRTVGCTASVPNAIGAYSKADADIKIKSLGSKGFAQGTAEVNPASPERQRFNFNTLQYPNPEWEMTWDLEGKNQAVKMRPAARFTTVEAQSESKITLGEAQLSKAEDPLTLAEGKALAFAWQWENLPESAYVTIQIGRTGQEKAVYCVFEAKSGKGEVPWDLIKVLPQGKQVVLVQLESNQFFATRSFITQSVDWRSTRIEKL